MIADDWLSHIFTHHFEWTMNHYEWTAHQKVPSLLCECTLWQTGPGLWHTEVCTLSVLTTEQQSLFCQWSCNVRFKTLNSVVIAVATSPSGKYLRLAVFILSEIHVCPTETQSQVLLVLEAPNCRDIFAVCHSWLHKQLRFISRVRLLWHHDCLRGRKLRHTLTVKHHLFLVCVWVVWKLNCYF